MSDIKVDLEVELPEQWARAQGTIAQGIKRAVENACTEGAQEARTVHRYKDRTGKLTASIAGKLDTFDHLGAEGHIEATAPYASYVENGTRPHDIWPKEGHGFTGPLRRGQSRRASNDVGTHRVALRWFDQGGVVHFARMVHHPGGKPYPFMGPAYLKAERVLERDIGVAIAKAEEELT